MRTRAQQPQNPSPMAEHTRAHPRLNEQRLPGRRVPLAVGTLFVPDAVADRAEVPLLIHFHGPAWIAEIAGAGVGAVVVAAELGSGSSVYARPFQTRGAFAALLAEAEAQSGKRVTSVMLSAWSAGYGAVREILRGPDASRVSGVLLIDGLHTDYLDAPDARSGLADSSAPRLETSRLAPFLTFARAAVEGRVAMLVTHSEIFPGTYASTTECADWLLGALGVARRATLEWGPMGTQQLSEAHAGRFRLLGFAGNTAPDHVDQLHALPEFVRRLGVR